MKPYFENDRLIIPFDKVLFIEHGKLKNEIWVHISYPFSRVKDNDYPFQLGLSNIEAENFINEYKEYLEQSS